MTDENTSGESERAMADSAIVRDGQYYKFDGYRYERLADAVAYAALKRPQQPPPEERTTVDKPDAGGPLSVADHLLMFELSITFERGSFVFNGFRYDRLADAANYARLVR